MFTPAAQFPGAPRSTHSITLQHRAHAARKQRTRAIIYGHGGCGSGTPQPDSPSHSCWRLSLCLSRAARGAGAPDKTALTALGSRCDWEHGVENGSGVRGNPRSDTPRLQTNREGQELRFQPPSSPQDVLVR